MDLTKKLNQSDILGVAASGLCAIHCTITPLFFAARPLLESTHEHHAHGGGLWGLLDYAFLLLSLLAVGYSARHTSHKTIKRALWIAWLVFAFGLLAEPLDIAYGIYMMYAGSIALVVTHIQNYRYCQKCKKEGIH
jgi:hypothetical protein